MSVIVKKKSLPNFKKYMLVAFVLIFSCMFQACSKTSQNGKKDVSSDSVLTSLPPIPNTSELPTNTASDPDITNEPNTASDPDITNLSETTPTLLPLDEAMYIEWRDPGLEALIREVINKPEGEIRLEELETIKELCIVDQTMIHGEFSKEMWSDYNLSAPENATIYDIKDWSDLSYLTNLNHLVLCNNDITDISFIQDLTKITFLNLRDNDIADYRPLSGLTSLKQLYLGYTESARELGFLHSLPIEDIDQNMDRIYYPFQLSDHDCIQGITLGNLINTGSISFDGRNLYALEISWGDLPHGSLLGFDVKTNKIKNLSFVITDQMAEQWDCSPGDYINEDIRSLNYHKDHIYYISCGWNNNSAAPLDNGEYYIGDEVSGIIRMNVHTKERELLTTESFRYICIARDHIYGVTSNDEFVQMSLDGTNRKLVVKESCILAYVNDEVMYYLTAGKDKKLMQMMGNNEKPQLLFDGDIVKPIIQGKFIFYMDASSYLYRYDMINKEKRKVSEYPIESYNLDADYLYILAQNVGLFRSNLDGSNVTILYDSWAWEYSIQVVGDYLFVGAFPEVWKIKKDGTEYNVFYEY